MIGDAGRRRESTGDRGEIGPTSRIDARHGECTAELTPCEAVEVGRDRLHAVQPSVTWTRSEASSETPDARTAIVRNSLLSYCAAFLARIHHPKDIGCRLAPGPSTGDIDVPWRPCDLPAKRSLACPIPGKPPRQVAQTLILRPFVTIRKGGSCCSGNPDDTWPPLHLPWVRPGG